MRSEDPAKTAGDGVWVQSLPGDRVTRALTPKRPEVGRACPSLSPSPSVAGHPGGRPDLARRSRLRPRQGLRKIFLVKRPG